MKRLFLFFFLAFPVLNLLSQVKPGIPPEQDGNDIQDIIENNAQISESESFDYDAYIDELENFKQHPINLNNATVDILNDFPLLNAQHIANLLGHIEKNGKLLSIFELQGIPGFDILLIQRMLPYVMVDSDVKDIHVSLKKLLSKGNFVFLSRYKQQIEKSAGYKRTDGKGYTGSPFNLFVRFRYTYGTKFSYGFTAEKDAGEEFFKGSNKKGFDYYSGHLFLRNIKQLKALALGDYEIRLCGAVSAREKVLW
ncbi:MAG: helix-hairpin-helix domain-containing protein [Bacteroidota bacterium]